jgi:ribosome biogenesis GTPase A
MAKAKRMMQENIKLVDVIIELLDARIPTSSRNPDMDTIAGGKSRVIVLNKCDMADDRHNSAWVKYYEEKGFFVALADSKSGSGIKQVRDIVEKACEAKRQRDLRRGILSRPLRAMVAGIPNVGKSTFINRLAGRASARTGNKPGITKGKQWIKLGKNIELLDTPGLLWPKFDDRETGLHLALIGSISDNIINTTELSLELILALSRNYPDALDLRYGIGALRETDSLADAGKLLEQVAIKRGCLIKGGEPDPDRAALILLDDFRNCRLGKITLEYP